MIFKSDRVSELILRCEVCDETKPLTGSILTESLVELWHDEGAGIPRSLQSTPCDPRDSLKGEQMDPMTRQAIEDRHNEEPEKVSVRTSDLCTLYLHCSTCDEWRELCVEERRGGHSWKAAKTIADEFDRRHDEECGEC
jgi:hypothetical protein